MRAGTPIAERWVQKCEQEVFGNQFGSRMAVVCSCGFATTYSVTSKNADQIGRAHFDRMHADHIERTSASEERERVLREAIDNGIMQRAAALIAHRVCIGAEHDPANGKLHGDCVVCGVPWPCQIAALATPAPEKPAEKESE